MWHKREEKGKTREEKGAGGAEGSLDHCCQELRPASYIQMAQRPGGTPAIAAGRGRKLQPPNPPPGLFARIQLSAAPRRYYTSTHSLSSGAAPACATTAGAAPRSPTSDLSRSASRCPAATATWELARAAAAVAAARARAAAATSCRRAASIRAAFAAVD